MKTMKNQPGLIRRTLMAALAVLGMSGCTTPSADAEHHKQESMKFLSENRQKPDVITTPSGLQYQVLKEGGGASPKATDTVTVNYRGSLVSGNEFDSGEGVSFPLNRVIPGWTEGLQLMKEGAKYRFFIPPELAYGETGAGRVIPPNAALIFEVELVKVGPS
jgi:FKBP-type peptidyl-prolyl cis-trans isomerase